MDQQAINLPEHVQVHRDFLRSWRRLPADAQQAVRNTIIRLREAPSYPSLHVHALKRLPGVQECYVSRSLRLLYRLEPPTLYLIDVGPHRCIERAHLQQPR